MSTGIYQITKLINGKVYIGHSVGIEKRWNTHIIRCYHGKLKTTS
jgi:hypothetical protein